MHYAILGNTHLRVSRIGFGCMSIKADEANGIPLIQQALDNGINYFDTADLYEQGANESLLGKALTGRRHQAIIATKVGNQWRPDGSSWDWNPTKAYIISAVEQSLRRLRTDHIDLYQLHGGTIEDPVDETIEAFELLKSQGKILHYGISSIRPNVIRTWTERSAIASVMMQYSLLDRRPEETALQLLQSKGIGVVVRGSVAQGLLAGKGPKPYLDHPEAAVARAAQAIKDITGDDKDGAQTAIGFTLHHPAVTAAIVGIRTPEQLQQALKAGDAPPLTNEQWTALSEAAPALDYREHR